MKKNLGKRSITFSETPLKKDLYLYVIKHIKDTNKLPSISHFNNNKSQRQYYVTKLKKANIIRKKGYGVWEILPQNLYLLDNAQGGCYTSKDGTQGGCYTSLPIRAHGFQFTMNLMRIKNWHKRTEYLKKKNIDFENVGVRKSTPRIIYKDCKIWLGNKTIIIYFPKDRSYYAKNAFEGQRAAINDLHKILRGIERLLKCSFKINGEYCIFISKHHYSNIENDLAKDYNKKNTKLKIVKDGKVWLIIDNSFNLNELETVNSKSSQVDMDNIVMPWFNSMKDYYDQTGMIITPFNIMEMITGLTTQHANYASNIALHIESIRELAECSKRQTEILDKIEKRMRG